MKLIFSIFIVLVHGCLTGCVVRPMTAKDLGGIPEKPPGLQINVDCKSDGTAKWSLQTDADFKGTGTVDVGPEIGRYKVEFTRLDSKASDVIEAQGVRAAALAELRAIEAERMVQQQKLINDQLANVMASITGMLSNVLTAIAPLLVPEPPAPPSPPIEVPPISIGGAP